jgi:hypothetical protein
LNAPFAPFLTELDSRAEVKGSRDPLGIQSVWVRFGRHVVGNLTTVSSSLRDFTTLILGYWLVEEASAKFGAGSEVAMFLRWEQLAAYARLQLNQDAVFRGIERTKKALSESRRVTLSSAPQHQILSNQKVYGLWGLYSVPSAVSGLVFQDPPSLTSHAHEFVAQAYGPVLQKSGVKLDELVEFVSEDRARVDINDGNRFVRAAAAVLKGRLLAAELPFYRYHLIEGGPDDATKGLQKQLAELLSGAEFVSQELSPGLLRALAKSAAQRGLPHLESRLDRIRACESFLAPASLIFVHMLGLDGQTPEYLAKRLKEQLGPTVKTVPVQEVELLREELGHDDAPTGERWVGIARALASGDYPQLIKLLVDQNKSVMAARGGAPWIEIQDSKFSVRFRDEMGALPMKSDLPPLWRYPYFIPSLRLLNARLGGE